MSSATDLAEMQANIGRAVKFKRPASRFEQLPFVIVGVQVRLDGDVVYRVQVPSEETGLQKSFLTWPAKRIELIARS